MRRVLWLSRRPIVIQTVALSVSTVLGALLPVVMGHSVDAAITSGLASSTWQWLALLLGLITVVALADGINQVSEIASFLNGCLHPARAVAHRIARAGRGAKQDKPAGDVVAGVINDVDMIGMGVLFVAEVASSALAIVVVTIFMYKMSTLLATMVVIGLPLTLALIALVVKPLQKKFEQRREEQGKLATISTDAVMGLRVLRGVGGEEFYNQQYRQQSQKLREVGVNVAHNQAALTITKTTLPNLFIAIVTGVGALLAFQGQISVGELVAFAGITAYLATPFNIAGQAAYLGSRAWVGAGKLAEFSAVQPLTSSIADESKRKIDFDSSVLVDGETGTEIQPGILTALVCSRPTVAADLARRLARVDDKDEARLGQIDLRSLPVSQVRQGILLSEAEAQLFTGPLGEGLQGREADPPRPQTVAQLVYQEFFEEIGRTEGPLRRSDPPSPDARLADVMNLADAQDVLDSLPGGMSGELSQSGRNLSGGQRQRVALARALYADPQVLIAIEPTSAVDSHTEDRISTALQAHRSGKTTLVVTTSPLWLDKCDEVVFIDEDGNERCRGSHRRLLSQADEGNSGALAYRLVVDRVFEVGGDGEAPSSE